MDGHGGELDSSPRKVHDEEHLGVEIPETAHQISKGSDPFLILFHFFFFLSLHFFPGFCFHFRIAQLDFDENEYNPRLCYSDLLDRILLLFNYYFFWVCFCFMCCPLLQFWFLVFSLPT